MKKDQIFRAVESSSSEIIAGEDGLPKRIRSAKNFIANHTMDKWAFTKLVAMKEFNIRYGSEAKPFFYAQNFINTLALDSSPFVNMVKEKFFDWADKVQYTNLRAKFNADQKNLKRFELLVHIEQIPLEILNSEQQLNENQLGFDEGFKKEITKEINHRDRKLIKLAKEKLGATCAVCNFNFEKQYGLHGRGFIEIHHLQPINLGKRKSGIEDVVQVCSNCHRMLHKGTALLDIEDLKNMIREQANGH